MPGLPEPPPEVFWVPGGFPLGELSPGEGRDGNPGNDGDGNPGNDGDGNPGDDGDGNPGDDGDGNPGNDGDDGDDGDDDRGDGNGLDTLGWAFGSGTTQPAKAMVNPATSSVVAPG